MARRDLKFNRLYNSLMRIDVELNRSLHNLRPELESLGHHRGLLDIQIGITRMIADTRMVLKSFYDDQRDPHTPSTPI